MALEQITQVPKLPPRPVDGHKGLFGRVLVVGGSEGMLGAPALAATAALRLGSGLVQIAVPRAILHTCIAITPELIGIPLGKASGKDGLLAAAQKADAIVIGPGMSRSPEAKARLVRLGRVGEAVGVGGGGVDPVFGGERCAGVHLHGLAGQIAGEKWGRRGALARDVIEFIPEAVRRLE